MISVDVMVQSSSNIFSSETIILMMFKNIFKVYIILRNGQKNLPPLQGGKSLCGAESRHSAEIWNRHQMAHKRAIENRWVVTYNE